MIAPTKEPKLEDTTLEPKEKDTPQPATRTVEDEGDDNKGKKKRKIRLAAGVWLDFIADAKLVQGRRQRREKVMAM
ncbi:hypothetical protein GW17_00048946 [Ensete ventricosum]|nr:hypothetical protein GW17_00048946 [Ensete ventricosum]